MGYAPESSWGFAMIYYEKTGAANAVVGVVICGYVEMSFCFVVFRCRQIHTNYVAT